MDLERLNRLILQIEDLMKAEGLNCIDRDLVIKELNGRLVAQQQLSRTKDLQASMLPKWMNKLMRDKDADRPPEE